MTFSYRFDLRGEGVGGHGGDGYGNPSCDTLKQGDSIMIYYLSSQPEINRPGDPKARLDNETMSIAMAALIFPAILVFTLRKWDKKQNQA